MLDLVGCTRHKWPFQDSGHFERLKREDKSAASLFSLGAETEGAVKPWRASSSLQKPVLAPPVDTREEGELASCREF